MTGRRQLFTCTTRGWGGGDKKVQVGKDQEKAQSEKRFPLEVGR